MAKKIKALQSSLRNSDIIMGPPWNFHCLCERRGTCNLCSEYETMPVKRRARLDASIDYLINQPLELWSRPHASPLGDNIYVIRYKDENRTQHRIFGYVTCKHNAFVAVLAGFEKDGKYIPDDYTDRVQKARERVDRGIFENDTKQCLRGCRICMVSIDMVKDPGRVG